MLRNTLAISGLASAIILLSTACKKDPPVPVIPSVPVSVVKLTVKPTWNGAPFDKNTIYAAAGDQRIHVSLLKFYLAHVDLVADSSTARLFDADLFDVADGPLTRVLTAPIGSYHSVNMGLGLPPEINHVDISTISPSAPTGNNSGMYWIWATMYRFVLFEGHFDSDPNGTGEPPYNFAIHTGLDTCYRTRELPFNLNVATDDTARITITVDIARFFTDGIQVLDLSQGAVWHGEPEGLDLGLKVADLEAAALGVE